MTKNLNENKNAKHKFDVMYKIWLGMIDEFQESRALLKQGLGIPSIAV